MSETEVEVEVEVVEVGKPTDSARDVSEGKVVTVKLPRAAAEVLAQGEGAKLAELNDAKALLRGQL